MAPPRPGQSALDALSPAERAAVDELVSEARVALGDDLREVRLFGSRARGDSDESSDVDVALVVTEAGRQRRSVIQDLAFDLGLRHGVSLAPTVIEESLLAELRSRERRFALDLDEEGLAL
jgi:predicted nucleotidyltransferase